ncbi:hypothetical protein [Acinetobacter modestus]|uniref:hypothetical protein n=1 Tax=Acinetobacter modestus TaxID=1776740 RepID=UPI0030188C26
MMALALQGVLKMAEYCAQCANEYRIKNGFVGECKPNHLATVVCEGCGVIQVNHKGECVSHDCLDGNHAVEWQSK